MPLTACTIQEVLSTDNPNEGRVKVNSNFECLENTIAELQVAANTGTTIVYASTNIDAVLSYSGSAPVYSIGVVSSPTFSSLSSTTISTDGLVLNSIGTGTSILALGLDSSGNVVSSTTASVSSYWTSGSSGSYSIKAINTSGLDSTGDRAVAWGNQTLASGSDSTAWGVQTSATTSGATSSGYLTLASGNYSHSEGRLTTASGFASHAEGDGTTASGLRSHSEGNVTIASGDSSHAEGYQTSAFGDFSHAEGYITTAIGDNSHAEGYITTASGDSSHAEGQNTIAIGNTSHAEGYQTIASGGTSHSEGIFTTAIGDYSHSEGQSTTAIGNMSHAEGFNTTAIGSVSHAEGLQTTAIGSYSHAEGYQTIASGTASHAEGVNTIAGGQYSHAEGGSTTAIGDASHAEGGQTTAIGNASHAEGESATSIGLYSHAEGTNTIASGDSSHAEGQQTTAIGIFSHTEGELTIASGTASHAEGIFTTAIGNYSHSEGQSTTAIGDNSHAEGFNTTAIGGASHAEGIFTTAIGNYSHSEGFNTTASGDYSHAEGRLTTAIGATSHAEGLQTIAIGDYSHAQGSATTATGIASFASGIASIAISNGSFIHSQNSVVSGQRSVVLGGQNITGATNDTVYVPYLNILNISSGTPITSLAVDSNGMVVSGASIADLGNVLFVSENGNDNSGQKGNINKPWRNIYSAKSASTSGDTIYILPGTWTYDNRNSEGNPYNGQIETKVNLWKNGVTYYFMPGAKIKFYNQTVSGQIMYLFNPANVSGETCTVLGSLDWEGYSTGADSFNGHTTFFWADSSNDSGFTFSAEVKKLSSFGSEIYRLNRLVTFSSDTVVANFRLNADELYHQYVGGQSGAGATEFISGSDAVLNAYINVRERTKTTVYHMFQITGNFTRSNINFFGDKLTHSGNYTSIFLSSFTGVVNMNIKNMYWYGTFIQTQVSGGGIFNLTGNLSDYYRNSSGTGGVMYLTTANNTINLKGNITTNTGSVVGRYVVATTQPNTINIDGDIQFLGSATTTQAIFQTINRATVNYSGKILGTYGGPIAQTYTGTININNSFIQSGVDSSSAQIFQNGGSSSGTCRINNSYIEMRNNSNPLANGSYVKALLNNSTIINTGTGTTLSNTTNFGSLQLINSTIMTSGLTSVGYSSTGTPVVSSNSVANTNYNIASVYGTFNVINELTY